MKIISLENILQLSMLSIAGVAAFFSIYGLANIFSSAFVSVIIMGAVLEIGKLVTVSILYQFWKQFHFLLKTYLILAVIVLMAITSLGIFGYLSAAYQEDSIPLDQIDQQISLYDEQIGYKKQQLDQINQEINRTPASYVTKRMELQEHFNPAITKLNSEIEELTQKTADLKIKQIHTESHVGPIIYIAEILDQSTDDSILYVVFLIMLVFDPLAIGLTISANVVIVRRRMADNSSQHDEAGDEPTLLNERTNISAAHLSNMSIDSMEMYKSKLLSYNRSLTDQEKKDLELIKAMLAHRKEK